MLARRMILTTATEPEIIIHLRPGHIIGRHHLGPGRGRWSVQFGQYRCGVPMTDALGAGIKGVHSGIEDHLVDPAHWDRP
jgi:hypothetical protein